MGKGIRGKRNKYITSRCAKIKPLTKIGNKNDHLGGLSVLNKLRGMLFPSICPDPRCKMECIDENWCWLHFVLKHICEQKRSYTEAFYEPFREAHRKRKKGMRDLRFKMSMRGYRLGSWYREE